MSSSATFLVMTVLGATVGMALAGLIFLCTSKAYEIFRRRTADDAWGKFVRGEVRQGDILEEGVYADRVVIANHRTNRTVTTGVIEKKELTESGKLRYVIKRRSELDYEDFRYRPGRYSLRRGSSLSLKYYMGEKRTFEVRNRNPQIMTRARYDNLKEMGLI